VTDYIMKSGSKLLKVAICKLIINKVDICDYRTTMVALSTAGASDSVVYEYEKLHDDYYLEVSNEDNNR